MSLSRSFPAFHAFSGGKLNISPKRTALLRQVLASFTHHLNWDATEPSYRMVVTVGVIRGLRHLRAYRLIPEQDNTLASLAQYVAYLKAMAKTLFFLSLRLLFRSVSDRAFRWLFGWRRCRRWHIVCRWALAPLRWRHS